MNWGYVEATANFIGSVFPLALMGKAGRSPGLLWGTFAAPIRNFRGLFLFAALRLLAEYESQHQYCSIGAE